MLTENQALENRNRNEQRNKYPTLSYIPWRYSVGCTLDIQTEWALHCSYPLFFEIFQISIFRIKARNAFLNPRISPLGCCKISNLNSKSIPMRYNFAKKQCKRSNEIVVSRRQIKHVLRARSRKREIGSLIFRKRSGKEVSICPCHQIDKAITKYIKRRDREHTWAYDYCPTGATYLDLVWSPPNWSFSLFKLEFVALQINFGNNIVTFVKPSKDFDKWSVLK